MLDEPTDGLDPLGRSQIRELIETLKRRGKTIFLNSHILQEVELVCDRVAIMAHGRIRALGTIDSLIDQHSHSQDMELGIEVTGSEEACRNLFVGTDVDSIEKLDQRYQRESDTTSLMPAPLGSESMPVFRVRLSVDTQARCDAWIDRIRLAGISLLRLERKRLRLEDIFVRLVASLDTPAGVSTEVNDEAVLGNHL